MYRRERPGGVARPPGRPPELRAAQNHLRFAFAARGDERVVLRLLFGREDGELLLRQRVLRRPQLIVDRLRRDHLIADRAGVDRAALERRLDLRPQLTMLLTQRSERRLELGVRAVPGRALIGGELQVVPQLRAVAFTVVRSFSGDGGCGDDESDGDENENAFHVMPPWPGKIGAARSADFMTAQGVCKRGKKRATPRS